MPPKHLKRDTASFKLAVLEKAEIIGNWAAGEEFRVQECCVWHWRSEKTDLQNMLKLKKVRRSCVVRWEVLESNLAE